MDFLFTSFGAVCSECCCTANFPNMVLWAYYSRTHQPSLAACPCVSYKLALLTYRSIQGTAPRYLQSCFTRVAAMMSRQRLQSSSSHHLAVSLQAASGRSRFPALQCGHSERSSASRHISAITGNFQTAPQVILVLSVLFGHSYLTHIAYYYLCIFVDLAIIDII